MEPLPIPVPGERTSQTIRRIRDESGPVVPIELPGKVSAWAVTSYDTVDAVLSNDGVLYSKNPRHYTALHDGTVPPDWPIRQLIEGDHLLAKDGTDHRRLRSLVNRAFTPARVQSLAPRIQELTDELLDRLEGEGETVDLVWHFTEPLPVAVICELFGVPEPERALIRRCTHVLLSHTAGPDEAAAAGGELLGYLSTFIGRKRDDPGDDLTTALIRAQEADGDRLSDNEMLWILWLVLIAGHETTVHLLANAVIALCTHRDQLAAAQADDSWEQVVEETLRSRNSVMNVLFRYPLDDVSVAGTTIRTGEPIMVAIGGAGTDPARYGEDAGRFDISREQEPHLAFGRGPHFCLGAPLARLESRIALRTLFTRFPGLRLSVDADDIPYTSSLITEGPTELPVVLGAPA
ncbi:putative cytochrome P450 hydroxylase [[Actinomadura] parvosata subsp. kistnae]|uniref:cytochrome P450 family protein n=1 Tax=[Actinomadura] parvosata TaxID=1955412 RepID=UPI0009ABBFB4|nr:cytochrome P450 [Nonomuraea sp. ATCC 55076]SPL96436.1 putative cytochrome P450 hydroxylase [Actinomadura parvosata subsp. kistnae]